MKSFQEFIAAHENGLRTSLGIYPPQYGAGQYPPLYFAPIAADAGVRLQTNHGIKCTGKGKCSNVGGTKKSKAKKHKSKSKK